MSQLYAKNVCHAYSPSPGPFLQNEWFLISRIYCNFFPLSRQTTSRDRLLELRSKATMITELRRSSYAEIIVKSHTRPAHAVQRFLTERNQVLFRQITRDRSLELQRETTTNDGSEIGVSKGDNPRKIFIMPRWSNGAPHHTTRSSAVSNGRR